jgi:hypothetical protein
MEVAAMGKKAEQLSRRKAQQTRQAVRCMMQVVRLQAQQKDNARRGERTARALADAVSKSIDAYGITDPEVFPTSGPDRCPVCLDCDRLEYTMDVRRPCEVAIYMGDEGFQAIIRARCDACGTEWEQHYGLVFTHNSVTKKEVK